MSTLRSPNIENLIGALTIYGYDVEWIGDGYFIATNGWDGQSKMLSVDEGWDLCDGEAEGGA